MSKRSAHVIPSLGGGWAVRKAGAARASKIFDTQQDAEAYARDLAKREHMELYVHRRDGTIREKNIYRNDPLSPKDKN